MKNFLSITAIVLSFLALTFSLLSYRANQPDNREFRAKILHLVRECVQYSPSIQQKNEIFDLLGLLESQKYILESGSDQLRAKYVLSQGCIEHVLACNQALGDITDLIGVIHTPTPATPLCTKPEPLDIELLDESIRFDPEKLLTVRSRADIVRQYLTKGGVLYIVYPIGGLEKRTSEQRAIYLEELQNYPHHLIDWELSTKQLDPDMVGATYFFKNSERRIFAFSIKARQANDPQEMSEWGLWLGEISDPVIRARIEQLFAYFKDTDGPTARNFNL